MPVYNNNQDQNLEICCSVNNPAKRKANLQNLKPDIERKNKGNCVYRFHKL